MKKSIKFAATAAVAVLTIGVIVLFMALQNRPETDTTGTTDSVYHSANDIDLEKPLVEDPRPISCDAEMDEEPVTILTEKYFESGAKELKRCYELLQEGDHPDILFQFLPEEDSPARETKIANLRTEIMAGKGPDAFLLSSDKSRSFEYQPLFTDPEGAMRSNLFLPLNDLVNESGLINMSKINTTVFDAGKVGNTQYILPILYGFPMATVNADDLAVDELPTTWQEVVDCPDEKLRRTLLQAAAGDIGSTFPKLADYDAGTLAFSQEELLNRFQEIQKSYEGDYENKTEDIIPGSHFSAYSLHFLERSKVENKVFIPIPTEDGGVSATVMAYAAVNANAKHPRAAFSVLETLFRDELLTRNGMTRPNYNADPPYDFHYGSNFYGVSMMNLANGISVMDKAFLDTDSYSVSQEDREKVKQCVDRIDRARITSPLDSELSYGTVQVIGANADTEKTAKEAYAAMQMMLAES